jgi:hypothetical protein
MAARETRQTWFEVLITPIVIAVVGALGTFVVTREQDRHASELKDAEIRSARQISDAQLQSSKEIVLAQLANAKDAARSAQEVKLLEIFAQQIASNDEVVRLAAVRLLGAVDAELGAKLARGLTTDATQPGSVKDGAAAVLSQLDASIIQSIVADNTAAIRQDCWQHALVKRSANAPRSARVTAQISVAKSGDITTVTTSGDPDGYVGLSQCIESNVRTWHFPNSKEATTVNIPFVFGVH